MKTSIFKDQINRLLEAKDLPEGKSPSKMRLNEYHRALKYIIDEDFVKVVAHLIDEYKFNNFPQIWDFKQAYTATMKPQSTYHKNDAYINKSEFSKELLALAKKYPPLNKEKRKKPSDVYRRMVKENKVWSYQDGNWVDKSEIKNIGGSFLYPENELKAMQGKNILKTIGEEITN